VVAGGERGGRFAWLPDFLRRTPATLKRAAIENLIWVGGLDTLGIERRDLLWQTGLWLGPEAETEAERRRRELATSGAGRRSACRSRWKSWRRVRWRTSESWGETRRARCRVASDGRCERGTPTQMRKSANWQTW